MYVHVYVCIQIKKEKQLIYLEIAFCINQGIFIAEELRRHTKSFIIFMLVFTKLRLMRHMW